MSTSGGQFAWETKLKSEHLPWHILTTATMCYHHVYDDQSTPCTIVAETEKNHLRTDWTANIFFPYWNTYVLSNVFLNIRKMSFQAEFSKSVFPSMMQCVLPNIIWKEIRQQKNIFKKSKFFCTIICLSQHLSTPKGQAKAALEGVTKICLVLLNHFGWSVDVESPENWQDDAIMV